MFKTGKIYSTIIHNLFPSAFFSSKKIGKNSPFSFRFFFQRERSAGNEVALTILYSLLKWTIQIVHKWVDTTSCQSFFLSKLFLKFLASREKMRWERARLHSKHKSRWVYIFLTGLNLVPSASSLSRLRDY